MKRKMGASELKKLYNKYNANKNVTLSVGDADDKILFEVKHRLDNHELTNIVTYVSEGVVDVRAGTYHPELKDYLLRLAVLKTYANFELQCNDNCWELVYGTPIFAMITGHDRRPVVFDGREYDDNMVIDVEQYEQLLAAIDRMIDFLINAILQTDMIL